MTDGDASAKRRVLITGAGGGIGTSLAASLKDVYDLRLHYRTPPETATENQMVADITVPEQLTPVMDGIDSVLHLAGDPRVPAPWEDVLQKNIVGMYNVLEAARLAGVRRVVFASTNHVMGMYDRDQAWPVYNSLPVRPDSFYGVSKAFGENLGRYYYDEWGLEFIALRIGWFLPKPPDPSKDWAGDVGRAMWLSPRDCAQVFRCAVEAHVPFGIFYAVSDNPDRRWDLTDTIVKLGYRPQDSWATFEEDGAEDMLPRTCACGCGAMVSKRSLYRQGHDQRHKGILIRATKRGDTEAANLLVRKGWKSREDVEYLLPSDAGEHD